MALQKNVTIDNPVGKVATTVSNAAEMEALGQTVAAGVNLFGEVQDFRLENQIEDKVGKFTEQEERIAKEASQNILKKEMEDGPPAPREPAVREMEEQAERIRLRREQGAISASRFKAELANLTAEFIDTYPGFANKFRATYQSALGGFSLGKGSTGDNVTTGLSKAVADEELMNAYQEQYLDLAEDVGMTKEQFMSNPVGGVQRITRLLQARAQDEWVDMESNRIDLVKKRRELTNAQARDQMQDMFINQDFAHLPAQINKAVATSLDLGPNSDASDIGKHVMEMGENAIPIVQSLRGQHEQALRRKYRVGLEGGVSEAVFSNQMAPLFGDGGLWDTYESVASGELRAEMLERNIKILESESYQRLLRSTDRGSGMTGADVAALGKLASLAPASQWFQNIIEVGADEELGGILKAFHSGRPLSSGVGDSNTNKQAPIAIRDTIAASQDPRLANFMGTNPDVLDMLGSSTGNLMQDAAKNIGEDFISAEDIGNVAKTASQAAFVPFLNSLERANPQQHQRVLRNTEQFLDAHQETLVSEALPDNFATPNNTIVNIPSLDIGSVPGVGGIFRLGMTEEERTVGGGRIRSAPEPEFSRYIKPVRDADGNVKYPLQFRVMDTDNELRRMRLSGLNTDERRMYNAIQSRARELNAKVASQINDNIKGRLNIMQARGEEADPQALLDSLYSPAINQVTTTADDFDSSARDWIVANSNVIAGVTDKDQLLAIAEREGAPESVIRYIERSME